MIRSKFLLMTFAFSFSTCTSAIRQKFSHQPAPAEVAPATAPVAAEAPPVVAPPVAAPAAISSGQSLISSGSPYQIFIHAVPTSACADSVDTKILFFSKLRETAVITRENCQDVPARTLIRNSFTLADFDETVLIYGGKLFNREDHAMEPLVLYCGGGADSGGRKITTSIRRLNGDKLNLHLAMKGTGAVEMMDFPVQMEQKAKLTVYAGGIAGTAPSIALSLGNFKGLTSFLTYNILFPGAGQLTRKEINLSLPNCAIP